MTQQQPPPPDQLPGFRLRQLQPREQALASFPAASRNGLVSMRRRSYDDLVSRNPDAVLTYLDDDDDDHVTVGTSFELLQRLEEPLYPTPDGRTSSFHAFDIADSDAVRRDWQPYVDRSATVALPSLPRHEPESSLLANLSAPRAAPPEADPLPPNSGSLTPAGKQQIKEAAAALQRASKNPPHLAEPQECSPHTTRWVSYATLPASFNPPLPLSVAQQPEEEPAVVPDGAHDTTKKPLLALFEAELAKLNGPPLHQQQDDAASSTASTTGSSTAATTGTSPGTTTSTAAQTQPNYQSSQTQTTATTNATSREVLGNSVKTLFDGIGLLKSTTFDINQELRKLASTVPNDLMELIRARVTQTAVFSDDYHALAHTLSRREKRIAEYRKKVRVLQQEMDHFLDESSIDHKPEDQESALESESFVLPEEARLMVTASANPRRWPKGCGNDCLQGCSKPACPIRALVKGAHSRLFPQEHARLSLAGSSVSGPSPPSFKVDVLLARRYITYDSLVGPRKRQYLVRWVGHGPEADVWYDVESLVHCDELVAKYDREHPEPEQALLVPRPASQTRAETLNLAHLHSRAADRMVTFHPDAPEHETFQGDDDNLQAASLPRMQSRPVSSQSALPTWTRPQELPARKPKPIWAGDSQAERLRPLRHQKSWHGLSRAAKPKDDTDSFDFSPMAVMKKYPPVALVDTTTVRAGEHLGQPNAVPSIDPSEKPAKAVAFAHWPQPMQGVVEPSPVQEIGGSPAAPPTDPTLYAPPSPVMPTAQRQPTSSSRWKPVTNNDPLESSLRRARSLNLRPSAPPLPEERPRDRRDRFRLYGDHHARAVEGTSVGLTNNGRSEFDSHASGETANLRRANTTAGVPPASRRADGLTSRGRSIRDESDTRRDNIAHCRFRLSEMGFPSGEASVVSEAVSGDLESALDILNEDGRARDELERHTKRSRHGYAAHDRMQMPGAFPWR